MSTPQNIRTFEEFRDVVFAFRLPQIILTALQLQVFTVMGEKSWTSKSLSKTLNVNDRGLDILCRNLASAGLLIKNKNTFHNGPFAKKFLNQKSEHYRGEYLNLMEQQWDDWKQLKQSVMTGVPVEEKGSESDKDRRAFSWAMHQRSIDSARQVAQQVDVKFAQSFLDVGGGPGTYALEFLKKNRRLQATVLDRPAALEVAQEIARPLKHGSRLNYQAGDFLTNPIQGKYDVIWLSNVIHIYSADINTKLLKKLRARLNPGGQLVIQDTFLLDQQGLHPVETNLFAVTMLLYTESGNTYSAAEVKQWLHKAGYRKTQMLKLKKGTGDWEGTLIQAS